MNEPGYCPNCGTSFDGGSIWKTGFDKYGSEEEADRYAKAYGATRTTGRWSRRIGIYGRYKDPTVSWMCPDCGFEYE